MTPSAETEPGSHLWKASAFTTRPTLPLPPLSIVKEKKEPFRLILHFPLPSLFLFDRAAPGYHMDATNKNKLILPNYYMANPVLGKSLCSDWFFLGQDFAVRTVSMVQSVYFLFGAKPANSKFATKTAKKCEYCHSSH